MRMSLFVVISLEGEANLEGRGGGKDGLRKSKRIRLMVAGSRVFAVRTCKEEREFKKRLNQPKNDHRQTRAVLQVAKVKSNKYIRHIANIILIRGL